MDTLGESFINQHSAPAAHLGRVARVNLYHTAASFFRFAHCELYQLIPCYIRNAFSQAMVLNHPVNVQVLKSDKAIAVDHAAASLMSKVAPLVGDAMMNVNHNLFSFDPFRGPIGLLAQLTLRFSQGLLFFPKEAGIFDSLTIREGQESSQAEVNPYCQLAHRQRFWLNFTRETSEPVTHRIALDSQGFDRAFERSVQLDFDIPYLGDSQPFIQLKARLFEREAIIPTKPLKAREAIFLARLEPAKEGFISQIDPLLHILQDLRMNLGECGVIGFPTRQNLIGVVQTQGFLLLFPRLLTQTKRRIVDMPARFKGRIEFGSLRFGWKHPELVRLSHTIILRKKSKLSSLRKKMVNPQGEAKRSAAKVESLFHKLVALRVPRLKFVGFHGLFPCKSNWTVKELLMTCGLPSLSTQSRGTTQFHRIGERK